MHRVSKLITSQKSDALQRIISQRVNYHIQGASYYMNLTMMNGGGVSNPVSYISLNNLEF